MKSFYSKELLEAAAKNAPTKEEMDALSEDVAFFEIGQALFLYSTDNLKYKLMQQIFFMTPDQVEKLYNLTISSDLL